MKKQDEKLINVLVKLMSSTNFGDFLVNTKRGDSLGSQRSVLLYKFWVRQAWMLGCRRIYSVPRVQGVQNRFRYR